MASIASSNCFIKAESLQLSLLDLRNLNIPLKLMGTQSTIMMNLCQISSHSQMLLRLEKQKNNLLFRKLQSHFWTTKNFQEIDLHWAFCFWDSSMLTNVVNFLLFMNTELQYKVLFGNWIVMISGEWSLERCWQRMWGVYLNKKGLHWKVVIWILQRNHSWRHIWRTSDSDYDELLFII